MNRLNWIQQEQKVADYHVITWRTSHFHHPRNRTDIIGSFHSKLEGGAAAGAGAAQQAEGIGLGLEEPFRRTEWKSGGLGTDGMMREGVKNAANNELLSVSGKTQGKRTDAPESMSAVIQAIVPEELYSVVNSVGQSVHRVRSRIKQSVTRLRDTFLRQQTKQQRAAGASVHKAESRRQPEGRQKGTRRVDKEEMLSMQTENSYLLDSYDRNGQYSRLGSRS
ncbi:MAG: hypothetical protein NC416_01660 [Eubacterium sp.]|nr:hypothetical protein [Eubacterium sp.]